MSEHDGDAPNLRGMTRAELDAHAGERGIADATDYPNKDALIAAIEALPPTEPDAGADRVPPGRGAGTDADGDGDGDAGGSPPPPAVEATERYRVLKAVTIDAGKTYLPGQVLGAAEAAWPSGRLEALVRQKYLRRMGD